MIVREKREDAQPGDIICQSKVTCAEDALKLDWLVWKGAQYIWEPDHLDYGYVFSKDGRILALIYKEPGE